MTRKPYTTTELEEIRSMLKDGYSCKDIADITGRSETAIRAVMYKYDMNHSAVSLRPAPNKGDKPEFKEVPETKMPKTLFENVIPEKNLDAFPDEDIIRHLYKLGYRIKNGELVHTTVVEQRVNLRDVING